MLNPFRAQHKEKQNNLSTSKLLDETSFYEAFIRDLDKCLYEAIVECPFFTNKRLDQLLPTLQKLKDRRVRIIVNTRDPRNHDDEHRCYEAMSKLQHRGIQVLFTNNHHRKLAILDRHILYEGSLNIFSQNNSREVMRRIESVELSWQMITFIGID